MENGFENIPAEKFEFADRRDISHDKKFETKPVGYFQDAFRRFCKNKGSIVGAVVIIILVLFGCGGCGNGCGCGCGCSNNCGCGNSNDCCC